MKLKVLALALGALVICAPAAQAADYLFDLSGEAYAEGFDVGPYDLTGEIYGLSSDSAVGEAASNITVNDPVIAFLAGGPVDFGGGGAFNVMNGAITSAQFSGSAGFFPFDGQSLTLNNGEGSYDGSIVELGFYGIDNGVVTYSSVTSAAPEAPIWTLMIAGLGGMGVMLRVAKDKVRSTFDEALSA